MKNQLYSVVLRQGPLAVALLTAICLATPSLMAQSKAKTAGTGRARPSTALPVVTPEREAAALTFVRRHHPPLAELLIHLEEQDKRQYQRAIRDLFRTSERLAQLQERDADRYQFELRVWKIQSRIQLYSAQLAMQEDPAIRQRLKEALREQDEVQRQLLQRERQRLSERLKRIDEQLNAMKTRSGDLDSRIDTLVERNSKGARARRDRKGD